MTKSNGYTYLPRATSTYRHQIFEELEIICDQIDFRLPCFRNKHKRNRSIGSVQAFIVELAIGDDQFRKRLRKYMEQGGAGWKPTLSYFDRYFD